MGTQMVTGIAMVGVEMWKWVEIVLCSVSIVAVLAD